MLYLYLDESGDLGFDFVNKKPSAFFTICALAIKGQGNDRALTKAVREVVKRKLYKGTPKQTPELKGSGTSIEIKKFLYNYIARLTLERVEFKDAAVRVIITVDKSKSRHEILGFNEYVISQIKSFINPVVPLEIYHALSQERPGLQAADMFAWGISRKYENGDRSWYDVFKTHVKVDRLYLPLK